MSSLSLSLGNKFSIVTERMWNEGVKVNMFYCDVAFYIYHSDSVPENVNVKVEEIV